MTSSSTFLQISFLILVTAVTILEVKSFYKNIEIGKVIKFGGVVFGSHFGGFNAFMAGGVEHLLPQIGLSLIFFSTLPLYQSQKTKFNTNSGGVILLCTHLLLDYPKSV